MTYQLKCVALCILAVFTNLSYSFDFNDLKSINESCSARGTCRSGRGNRLDLSLDWKLVNCFCDDACIEYGDCCLEARAFNSTLMKTAHAKYECIHVEPFGSYYMKGKCVEGWANEEISELCLKASPESSNLHRDPFLDMPVTSLLSDVTYKNYYCAVCNNETIENLEVWHAQLSCPESIDSNETYMEQNLQYVNNSWGLYANNSEGTGSTFFTCHVYPAVKETITHKIRRCRDYISSCSRNWTNTDVDNLCYSYTTLVYGPPPEFTDNLENSFVLSALHNSNAYRNYHCAVCNFIEENDLSCSERSFRKVPSFLPVSFSLLFDFGKKNAQCVKGEIWDPFSKKCRPVVCLEENSEFREGRCVNISDSSSQTEESRNSTESDQENVKMKCDKLFINESDFTRGENGTIKVSIFRRTYDVDEYQTYKEGILVCIPNSYSRLMGWLTLFGLGLSCLCIIIHLITFVLVPDLRNLSGKNLASMCSALLVAYICFLITSLKEFGTNSCPVLASLMYYFFLASFSWMNVMAFDIWRTLQMATSELRLTVGKQWKKFISYSFYAWTLPLLSLIFVLTLDYLEPNWIDPTYLPELGKRLCWFGQRKAILVYFAAPLAAIMFMNIFFFIMAVRMIALTARSTTTLSCSQPHQVQLKLYLRLALLMGLSWISGIVAGYIQDEYMWYLFILLNAFQGLFILVAFTCTKKVVRALKGSSSLRCSYRKGQSKSSTSRQVLESQDSNHSHLSHTTSTNLSTINPITSKSPTSVQSP